MSDETEWLLKEASDLMEEAAKATDPQVAAFSANSAIVNLLGALLQEVSLLREELVGHIEGMSLPGGEQKETDEAELRAAWEKQIAAKHHRDAEGLIRAGVPATAEERDQSRELRARIVEDMKAGKLTAADVRKALRTAEGLGSLYTTAR